jgi:hypothetical protein
MLDLLKDPQNRELIAWIGSGVCVVVSEPWTAWLKLGAGAKAPPPAPAASATADRGGVAAGGDVTIATNRIPTGVWLLGAAGLALIALAVVSARDSTTLENSASVGGDMTGSTIEIDASGQ